MMQPEREQFLQLYKQYRHENQLNFYISRQKEFTRAQKQAIRISIVLIFLAALAGAIETIPISWLQILCLLTAAICPAISSALTGYSALYAFEQQAKIYRDAIVSLRKAQVKIPALQPEAGSTRSTHDLLHQYVQTVEGIFESERGQWGQLAKKMKPSDL